jgi:DNA-binding NtrC family response regulator
VEPKNILIVDDQENVAMILASSLANFENLSVEMVYDGRSTLEKCSQRFYDFVVADYQLPDITGVQIAKALQEISPKTRIILITALRGDMILESIAQDNIHYFLEKPFPLQKFMDIVKEALADVT